MSIRILVVDGVETRKFNIQFEVSGYTFDGRKSLNETDEQYIQRLLTQALNAEGLRMSE